MVLLSIAWFLFFSCLAYKNFRLAIVFFIILLPSYLIRLSIGSLPTTLMELSFVALFFVWLIKFARQDLKNIFSFLTTHYLLLTLTSIFLLSSFIGVLVSSNHFGALGIWRAYFFEPIILFFILIGRREQIKSKDLIWFLALSTLSISILAIIQKLTGQLFPPSLWDDELNGRVVAFFTSPNAVSLYLGPILMLVIGYLCLLFQRRRESSRKIVIIKWIPACVGMIVIIFLSFVAIIFTKSDGALVALAVGGLFFIFLIGYKKIALFLALVGIVLALLIPSLHQAVLFQDKAGQNRLELWSASWNYFSASPKNFIFGTGIRQFYKTIQKPLFKANEMEKLIYPHNIFLNFWTEIGLFGMLSFVCLVIYLFFIANKIRQRDLIMGSGLIACLTVIIIHGLVDVPYFKNDLAFLFWFLAVIILIQSPQISKLNTNITN
jgi:O-antigen ligase